MEKVNDRCVIAQSPVTKNHKCTGTRSSPIFFSPPSERRLIHFLLSVTQLVTHSNGFTVCSPCICSKKVNIFPFQEAKETSNAFTLHSCNQRLMTGFTVRSRVYWYFTVNVLTGTEALLPLFVQVFLLSDLAPWQVTFIYTISYPILHPHAEESLILTYPSNLVLVSAFHLCSENLVPKHLKSSSIFKLP
jgi:hypothetical protein